MLALDPTSPKEGSVSIPVPGWASLALPARNPQVSAGPASCWWGWGIQTPDQQLPPRWMLLAPVFSSQASQGWTQPLQFLGVED